MPIVEERQARTSVLPLSPTVAGPADVLISLPKIETPHGVVSVATLEQLAALPEWERAFAHQRKDRRYYEVVEETILQGFDYRYFVLQDRQGEVRAVQPFFLLNQDLLQGSGPLLQRWAAKLRKLFPRCLTIRTLMVGCAAGEGHLCHEDAGNAAWIADCLHAALRKYAKSVWAKMVVLKEFPADYREALANLAGRGYTRVPSLPMTRLDIGYPDFETYMTKALSKVTRKGLRRKFKAAAESSPIELQVVEDVTPFVDEIYPLYLQVYNRSHLHFEKLTKEYFCRLGRRMPDKVRFFIWRQGGKAVAFSLCMVNGDSLYDEYLGLDYSVALDLHLYFYTLRDTISWAMERGLKWYCSSALNYDPKLHLKSRLVPLDLYVAHTNWLFNWFLRRILPWLEPTRNDKTLAKFPNYADLWGGP